MNDYLRLINVIDNSLRIVFNVADVWYVASHLVEGDLVNVVATH